MQKLPSVMKNGLGKGLLDELLKEQFDPITGDTLECWNTVNTDDEPDDPDAEKMFICFTFARDQHGNYR